jgi:hypothetical protein
MPVLQKGKAIYPFWGASINLITGLDPLSLQTTSEASYATMLPGISNLTNRLRYYGFYCWLLNFYFKKEKKGNSTEQFKFIRRAELMVAIIMQSERKEVLQITGSNFADNLINSLTGKYFDLAAGADKDDNDKAVYWKYSSGAFGQYYYGAMRALSLVVAATNDDGDVIYNITQPNPRQKVSGKQLADAFDQTLNLESKDLLYNNIKKGILYEDDISELIKYFAIDKVYTNSSEWALYVDMLLDKDEPSQEMEENCTFHRRETILELLKLAKQNNNEYNWQLFLLKAYEFKLGTLTEPVSETMIGWYTYKFNEYYQYACGAIFWATLQHLYSFHQDQYLPSFVNKLAKAITEEICKAVKKSTPESAIKEILSSIHDELNEETLYSDIDTKAYSSPIISAKNGFLLLFRLYLQNKDMLHPLKEFMSRKKMIREGNMVDGLLALHAAEKDGIEHFVEQFLLRKIIYRHQMVAIRKMGNGSQSTHKFIIEEQYIRFIDTFPPRATSPRMVALWNLLSDLNVIDNESMLTQFHKKLLVE